MSLSHRVCDATPRTARIFAAVALASLLATGRARAVSYTWTNTTAGVGIWQDANSWSPVGVPGGVSDVGSFAFAGTITIRLTNSVINLGNFNVGAGSGSATLNITFDLGTNAFTGTSGDSSSSSSFVLGQTGTSIVYIAGSNLAGAGMLCTNAGGNPRLIIGRNGVGMVFVTNGNAAAGNLVIANASGAGGSKLVLSGPNTYWSNATTVAVGNAANNNGCSLVISNSASMTVLSTLNVPSQSASFETLLLDSNGRLFTKNQNANIGTPAGAGTNTVIVRGGAVWDHGGRAISVGGGGGIGNSLFVGDNGTVSNVTAVTIAAGNSLTLSGGVLGVSVAVTNNSGSVAGFGAIAGNVVFTGTGTLSPGLGTMVGTLTISNDLTLAAGTTTKIKLDSSQPGSNDTLRVVGTATVAGTLTVLTNGTAPLVAGDVYDIGVTGSFSATNLPALDPAYRWNNVTPGILAIVEQEVVPGIIGPTNQVVQGFGETVLISATVTGVPTPGVYWQYNGSDLTDGATGNGSFIFGSQTASLIVSNAQEADSGTYCIIATNLVGAATNCMALTVSTNAVAPSISGVSDQTVIEGNTGTFNASVAGFPAPAIQWQENFVDIPGATGVPLILTNVQFSQNGYIYTLIASNEAGIASTNLTLTVIVPPAIQQQPVSLVVTDTQAACFSVVSTNGVPPPSYQWFFNNNPISGATNPTYCIASATISNAGAYKVQVSNAAGSVTSSNATLTVNSTMTATLTPSNGAVNVCYDTPLYLAFDQTPLRSGTGTIKIYLAGTTNVVETIDTGLGLLQSRTVGGESFFLFPVIITGNTAAIYPRLGVLTSNQTYYVTVDPGTFTDTNGALFAGITSTNAWVFTTKPTGPANPNNIIVDAAGNGDFCTVQGAIDFVPAGNTVHRLVNIRNGTYTEFVNTRNKPNITFRGQSRAGTIVQYRNNDSQNPGTHNRMSFKVFSDDIAIDSLTLINTTPKGGSQAEALMLETNVKRFILNNSEVHSFQDTVLGNTSGTQAYFKDSLIEGDTDFIWGGMNLFATNCEIRSRNGGASITQPRTDAVSNGMAFVNCLLTRSSNEVINTTFARALGFGDGNVVFASCLIDSNLIGWTASDIGSLPNLRWWEFDNHDLLTGAPRTYNGTVLTNGDPRVELFSSVTNWLYGWTPALAPNILAGPTNLTVTPGQPAAFSVSATGVPDPTYQWQHAGTNLVGQTGATLSIASADAGDAGTYSVIVANSSGSVTNSATLTVILTPFQSWQNQYFGCTLCPQAAASADPDGDGLDNNAEFLAGTDPTSSASGLRIVSAQTSGNDVVVTWTTAGGRTNVVQVSSGDGAGGYSNNFSDLSGEIVIAGSGDQTTNYTDIGGATNVPSRYYRIRLVP